MNGTAAVPDALAAARDAHALLGAATARLRASGSPSFRLDAELLVAHAYARDRAWLRAHPEAELSDDAAANLASWLERRAEGEPIAYIRGFKEWFSLRLATDRRALIPRPETELLAEAAIAEVAAHLASESTLLGVCEVGTGCGAVALALALRFRSSLALGRLRLTASDLSPDALELAAENLAAHGVGRLVSLSCANLLEPVARPGGSVELVVANLPYLTRAEVEAGRGSLAWEPPMALDGGVDGLGLFRDLLEGLVELPTRPAVVLLEIGAGQAGPLHRLVANALPGARVTFLPDLAGIERVARVEVGEGGGGG